MPLLHDVFVYNLNQTSFKQSTELSFPKVA